MKLDFASGQWHAMKISMAALVSTAPDKELVLRVIEYLVAEVLKDIDGYDGASEYTRGFDEFLDYLRKAVTLEENPGIHIPFKLHAVPPVD